MLMFLRIERPMTTTLRPHSTPNVGGLLHAVDARGEGGDQDLPVPKREDRAEGLPTSFSSQSLGLLGVRRVPEEEIHAAASDLGELPDVGLEARRGGDEFPVTRVQDAARLRLDHERSGIRHECATRTSSTGNGKPELERRSGLGGDELGLLREPELVELRLQPRGSGVAITNRRRPRGGGTEPAHVISRDRARESPAVPGALRGSRCPAAEGRRRGARPRNASPASTTMTSFRARRRSCSCRPRRGRRAE